MRYRLCGPFIHESYNMLDHLTSYTHLMVGIAVCVRICVPHQALKVSSLEIRDEIRSMTFTGRF